MKRFVVSLSWGLVVLALSACPAPKEFVLKKPPAKPVAKNFPEDDVVYLLYRRTVRISSDSMTYREDTHVQKKALTERGRSGVRSAYVGYSPFTRLVDFQARLLRPGGWISKARRFADVPSGKIRRAKYFSDRRWKGTSFRHIVPGSVLEYRYTREGDTWYTPRMWFQRFYPVLRAEYRLSVPRGVGFRFKVYAGTHYPTKKIRYRKQPDPQDSNRELHIWTAENLPGVKPEIAMPPWNTRVARLDVVTERYRMGKYQGKGRTWSDFAAFYSKLVGQRDEPTSLVKKQAQKLIQGAKTKEEKIRRLYDFVRRHIRYINVGINLGGWQPQSAEFTLKQRYGDCKAKATLLKALLKAIGVKAHQVLVLTRNAGQVDKNFPNDRFNHVINYLPGFKGGLFVDATTDDNRLELLRADDQGASALIIDGTRGKFVTLPAFPPEKNRKKAHFVFEAKGEKIVTTLHLELGGRYRIRLDGHLERKKLESDKAKKGWARRQVMRRLGGSFLRKGTFKIHSVQFSGREKTYLRAEIRFEGKLHGRYKVDNSLVFQGLFGALYTKLLKKRKHHPLAWTSLTQDIRRYEFKGWTPLEYPKPLQIKNKIIHISVGCQVKEKSLVCWRDASFRQPILSLKEHKAFRKLYRRVRKHERRVVVLSP